MSEMSKSLVYVVVAVAALTLAAVTRPRTAVVNTDDLIGRELFREFKDPASARGLKIVRYDADLGKLVEFEVRQKEGQWVLPSNFDYPADAENRIRDAATQFVGLRVIGLRTNNDSEHATYGVLEPNEENRKSAAQGVGTLLEMVDADGKRSRLIVGAQVKDAEGQRYVRDPDQSAVYLAKIDLEKFPAKFEDWINRDLLDVNTFDIAKIVLKDYSVQTGMAPDGRFVVNYEQRFSLGVHEKDGKWELDELQESRGGQLEPSQLAEGEELNKERLTTLRDALEKLTIIGVERKPEGMRADLTADESFIDRKESVQSLIERGFYPVAMPPDNHIELLSADGEVIVQMKDGVEYVMRFGDVSAGKGEGDGNAQLNRYLFVSARVNKDLIPAPQLEQVPESPAETPAANPPAASPPAAAPETPAAEKTSQHNPRRGPLTRLVAAQVEPASGSGAPPADPPTNEPPTSEPPTSEPPTPTVDPSQVGQEPPAEAATGTDAAAAAPGAADKALEQVGSKPEDAAAKLDADRARVVKENQRKMDEYNEKVAKAETKKNDLNFRFADWYYVISEDVYKKVHLSRSDVIQVSEEAKQQGTGIGAARDLIDQELEGGLEDVPTEPPGDTPPQQP